MSEAYEAPVQIISEEPLSGLFSIPPGLRDKVFEIAERLEALQEYNRKQAIFVAVDIVRRRLLKAVASTSRQKESES